jgi:hypothetical protein
VAEVVSIIVTNKPKALEKKERKKKRSKQQQPHKKKGNFFFSLSLRLGVMCVFTQLWLIVCHASVR